VRARILSKKKSTSAIQIAAHGTVDLRFKDELRVIERFGKAQQSHRLRQRHQVSLPHKSSKRLARVRFARDRVKPP
jgi:hypothetical protein